VACPRRARSLIGREFRTTTPKTLNNYPQISLTSQHIHQFNCSIGAVVLADPTQSVETYIKQADIAMYQAKAAGRNTLCFYAGG
jgi:GGDEF domain-containing protein